MLQESPEKNSTVALGNTTSYSYDSVTNYLKALDYGDGDGVQYTYDSLGRTTAQTWENVEPL